MAFEPEWPQKPVVVCFPGAVQKAASASVRKLTARDARTIRKLRFEPSRRLHQPSEFREVRTRGRRLSDDFFSLSVLANHETHPRLGLAIATRTFGSAVARNRIKRLTRESFRLNQATLPSVDITVAARDAARTAKPADLRASLLRHWQSIARRW
jgi:ribonuclease P protein component